MKPPIRIQAMRWALSLALALAILAAALPAPVQAAACQTYYTIKEGDTTASIAHTFKLKWGDIADANDMEYPYKLKVGKRLCIPPAPSETTNADSLKMTVTAQGNNITITVGGLSAKAAFYVRVRDGQAVQGGWTKLGIFRAKKNTTRTQTFTLPKSLRDKLYIQICLKNGSTDELACRTAVHY